jgi:hypothetical protein
LTEARDVYLTTRISGYCSLIAEGLNNMMVLQLIAMHYKLGGCVRMNIVYCDDISILWRHYLKLSYIHE